MSNADLTSCLTVQNVSKLSTYELRQQLVLRSALDIPEEKINHKTMLLRLIQILLEDEQRAADEKTAVLEAEMLKKNAALKELRDAKKMEAIERSKQRQQKSEYFESKSELNVPPEKIDLSYLEDFETNNGENPDVNGDPSDPLCSFGKIRSKIHTR